MLLQHALGVGGIADMAAEPTITVLLKVQQLQQYDWGVV